MEVARGEHDAPAQRGACGDRQARPEVRGPDRVVAVEGPHAAVPVEDVEDRGAVDELRADVLRAVGQDRQRSAAVGGAGDEDAPLGAAVVVAARRRRVLLPGRRRVERGGRAGRPGRVAGRPPDVGGRVQRSTPRPAPPEVDQVARRAERQADLLGVEGASAEIGALVLEHEGAVVDPRGHRPLPVPARQRRAQTRPGRARRRARHRSGAGGPGRAACRRPGRGAAASPPATRDPRRSTRACPAPRGRGIRVPRARARRRAARGRPPGHGHSPPSTSQPSGCQTSSRTASAPGSRRRTSRSVSPGRAVSPVPAVLDPAARHADVESLERPMGEPVLQGHREPPAAGAGARPR